MKKNWKIKAINDLTTLQYEVIINSVTELPFKNKYWDNKEKGIYVDILSGEPLFAPSYKCNFDHGWPSFTRPIKETVIVKKDDNTNLMLQRTEVRAKTTDIHLGHVFKDGPQKEGAYVIVLIQQFYVLFHYQKWLRNDNKKSYFTLNKNILIVSLLSW